MSESDPVSKRIAKAWRDGRSLAAFRLIAELTRLEPEPINLMEGLQALLNNRARRPTTDSAFQDSQRAEARRRLTEAAGRLRVKSSNARKTEEMARRLADACLQDYRLDWLAPTVESALSSPSLARTLKVAVLGVFSSGKSSLINALLGEDLLRTGIVPVTACLTELVYSEQTFARVSFVNGEHRDIELEQLAQFVDERSADSKLGIERVVIGHPAPLLKRFTIFDTPGFNSGYDLHELVTEQVLLQSDAVLWVFNATKAGAETELRELRHVKRVVDKTIGILNQVDAIEPRYDRRPERWHSELDGILADMKDKLGSYVRKWVPVSARWIREDLAKRPDGYDQLMTALEEIHEGRNSLIGHARKRQLTEIARLGHALEVLRTEEDEASRQWQTMVEKSRAAAEQEWEADLKDEVRLQQTKGGLQAPAQYWDESEELVRAVTTALDSPCKSDVLEAFQVFEQWCWAWNSPLKNTFELYLRQAVTRLPDAAVPSNFWGNGGLDGPDTEAQVLDCYLRNSDRLWSRLAGVASWRDEVPGRRALPLYYSLRAFEAAKTLAELQQLDRLLKARECKCSELDKRVKSVLKDCSARWLRIEATSLEERVLVAWDASVVADLKARMHELLKSGEAKLFDANQKVEQRQGESLLADLDLYLAGEVGFGRGRNRDEVASLRAKLTASWLMLRKSALLKLLADTGIVKEVRVGLLFWVQSATGAKLAESPLLERSRRALVRADWSARALLLAYGLLALFVFQLRPGLRSGLIICFSIISAWLIFKATPWLYAMQKFVLGILKDLLLDDRKVDMSDLQVRLCWALGVWGGVTATFTLMGAVLGYMGWAALAGAALPPILCAVAPQLSYVLFFPLHRQSLFKWYYSKMERSALSLAGFVAAQEDAKGAIERRYRWWRLPGVDGIPLLNHEYQSGLAAWPDIQEQMKSNPKLRASASRVRIAGWLTLVFPAMMYLVILGPMSYSGRYGYSSAGTWANETTASSGSGSSGADREDGTQAKTPSTPVQSPDVEGSASEERARRAIAGIHSAATRTEAVAAAESYGEGAHRRDVFDALSQWLDDEDAYLAAVESIRAAKTPVRAIAAREGYWGVRFEDPLDEVLEQQLAELRSRSLSNEAPPQDSVERHQADAAIASIEASMTPQEAQDGYRSYDGDQFIDEVRSVHQAWQVDYAVYRACLKEMENALDSVAVVRAFNRYKGSRFREALNDAQNERIEQLAAAAKSKARNKDDIEAYRDWRARRTISAHSEALHCMDVGPDGLIYSGDDGGNLRCWRASDGRKMWGLAARGGEIYDMAVSSNGKNLVMAMGADLSTVWSTDTQEELQSWKHTTSVCSCSFSSDGRYIVSGDTGDEAHIVDIVSGVYVGALKGHTGDVTTIDYSGDGSWIATGSTDDTVRVWDTATRATSHLLKGHVDDIRRVRFSPDGKLLATASDDKTVRMWDVATGKQLCALIGHSDQVRDLDFNAAGTALVSCDDDGNILFWPVDMAIAGNNQVIAPAHRIKDPTGSALRVRFLMQAGREVGLVSANDDGELIVWGNK